MSLGYYNPKDIEKKQYDFWLSENYFHAEPDPDKEKYSITIPPPNVTGSLHIGHALCYSIHDVLIRWKRMCGYNTECIPGTDHAGIATQNKVEQKLAREGKTRFDLGREKFLEEVWAWKKEYGGQIIHQFKTMGFSFDWERERFTMDEGYADAVLEAFVRLYNKKYIYKGTRVINWCPRCNTAISDIEVEYKEQPSHLWHFKYPLEDGSGYITVATTRPETMLGDTAVAVNPNDERYKDLIGKNVILPLVDRKIPIIADDYVGIDFGTGAVKITPAHDPNDFEMGIRHNLPQIVVIANDGTMTDDCGKYAGMDRYEARKVIVKDIEALGLLDKIEDYTHQVSTCSRCGTTIEPLLSQQWFCKMKELAKPAIDAVKNGDVTFYPKRYERTYLDWMENVRDWCISRQLWWGHRIPVFTCEDCGYEFASKTKTDKCPKCGGKVNQETDVMDTWFSSALWPFATMGWPNSDELLKGFYPTDVLITARDIIYLWVARMIFSSLEYLEKIPFKDVYIYATVQNEFGQRMSKSLGTGVDPLEIIDNYGADALRYSLLSQAGKTQDIRFSEKRVKIAANFANKVWNASKFVIMNLEDFDPKNIAKSYTIEDKWILSQLQKTIEDVNNNFATYDMDDACKSIYEFIWNDYCDWYIELAKGRLKTEDRANVQYVLWYVLDNILKLLHPIMPFITEEIWQNIPHEGKSIMVQTYPVKNDKLVDEESESAVNTLIEMVKTLRNIRAELNVAPGKLIDVIINTDKNLDSVIDKVKFLTKADKLQINVSLSDDEKKKYAQGHIMGVDLFVNTEGLIDTEKEKQKINKELDSVVKELTKVQSKLSNEGFLAKAPEAVIEKQKSIEAELTEKKQKLEEGLSVL
ncbi:MAG: valine--tRNA ligase [Armatimonadetes bacterium]|nr:valine--tRNA ligase [Candidatus Hippobium faecium]